MDFQLFALALVTFRAENPTEKLPTQPKLMRELLRELQLHSL